MKCEEQNAKNRKLLRAIVFESQFFLGRTLSIQSLGVFMKSHRVPWTLMRQLFGQDGPLRNQLVHLGGHFGCQKVTLGTAKITLST